MVDHNNENQKMYKVKFTPYRQKLGSIYYRQTEGYNCMSRDGRYRFYVNEDVDSPDFWVVQGKGVRQGETCRVAPENTILLTTEPRSILIYPQDYLNQFGLVCTCQEHTIHPNIHLGPAILPWYVGYREGDDGRYIFTQDYDKLNNNGPQKKTKLMSVITSNKAFTQGHIDRIRFVEKLKNHYGDTVDVFGRGFNDFDDKWDVLAPYKYHIAIENSSQRYYWTEKISDCFLAETFPFYYGCTNLGDYFPQEAYLPIDIRDFDKSVAVIDRALAEDRYAGSGAVLDMCKHKVLDEYNMFEYAAALCDRLDPDAPKREVTIRPCHSMHDWHNFYNYTFGWQYYKMKMKVHNVFCGKIPFGK